MHTYAESYVATPPYLWFKCTNAQYLATSSLDKNGQHSLGQVYTYICTHTYTSTYILVAQYLAQGSLYKSRGLSLRWVHMYISTHTYIYISGTYVCIHMYIYIYIHTYISTYRCVTRHTRVTWHVWHDSCNATSTRIVCQCAILKPNISLRVVLTKTENILSDGYPHMWHEPFDLICIGNACKHRVRTLPTNYDDANNNTYHDDTTRITLHVLSMTIRITKHMIMIQPIPFGVTFSNAVSNLKAQSSNVSFATFQWKETFELWAWSFE